MKITQSILVASLALAATAGFGQTLSYNIDQNITLINPIVIWGTPNGTGYTGNDIVVGSDWSGSGSFNLPTGVLASGDPYTVVSYYNDSSSNSHVVFLSDASHTSSLTGADFQTTFGVSETEVLNAIQFVQAGFFSLNGQDLSSTSATAGLLSYFPVFGTSGTTNPFFGFSSGAQDGSVVTQAVPEPAAFVLLGLGIVALVRRRIA